MSDAQLDTTLGIVIIGIALTIAIALIVIAIRKREDIHNKLRLLFFGKRCHLCNEKTLNRSKSGFNGACLKDIPCCLRCQIKHEATIEPFKQCGNHCGPMMKVVLPTAVYDVCPKCGGKFTDKGELGKLIRFADTADSNDPDLARVRAFIYDDETPPPGAKGLKQPRDLDDTDEIPVITDSMPDPRRSR